MKLCTKNYKKNPSIFLKVKAKKFSGTFFSGHGVILFISPSNAAIRYNTIKHINKRQQDTVKTENIKINAKICVALDNALQLWSAVVEVWTFWVTAF